MCKSQIFGMQIQAVCFLAIQLIPYYRSIQTKRMSRMDTQLMGTPGFRNKRDDRRGSSQTAFTSAISQHTIISHSRFPMNYIDHLPRPIFRVRAEGEFEMSFFFLHNTIQPGDIPFAHRPVFKLCLQVLVHFLCLGNEHQTGCCHI